MSKPAQRRDRNGVRDSEALDGVVGELRRLIEALDATGHSLDDVYQSFRELDAKDRGVLSSSINFAAISTEFATRRGRFDYESFFKRMIAVRDSSNGSDGNGGSSRGVSVPVAANHSPSKRRSAKSVVSSPKKRDQRHERLRASESRPTDSSESDAQPAALPSMRVDRLLEVQQRLQAGIRKKLLLGMTEGRREGFLGVQDALFQLDPNGDGFLPLRVFLNDVLARLKAPLTASESDFLLAQLQARGQLSDEKAIGYEQLQCLFGVDSEDTASESDADAAGRSAGACPSPTRLSQLGSEYLAAEKRLSEFLRSPMSPAATGTVSETPRSVYTGAERFLELAEAVDEEKTGTLDEKCFGRILASCGVKIQDHLVLSMLSRFPREECDRVSYSAFLHRYGQSPEQARARRELKELVALLVARVELPALEWANLLRRRFEAYDTALDESKRGALVQPEFLHILSRHCEVTKVPNEQAPSISRVLARLSPDRLIRYHEFLQVVNDCAALTSTPKKSEGSTALLSESGESMSVGDYLMSLATSQERRNFEQLMDLLNAFRQQASSSETNGGQLESQPMPNGIALALGEKLKVQIQFSL